MRISKQSHSAENCKRGVVFENLSLLQNIEEMEAFEIK